MRIKLRCMPGYRGLVPEPYPASNATPDWIKAMPSRADSETHGGTVATMKQCPPLLDAVREGIVFPLATDLHVRDGELSWDWDLPETPGADLTESPIGLHVPEQAQGAPFRIDKGQFVIKFNNFWTVETPPGVSMMFSHPYNREDLPFRSLSGFVDVDVYNRGFVHFPALWVDPDFEGTLPRGTPVAQAVPIVRSDLELDLGELDDGEVGEQAAFEEALREDRNLYRKSYRQKRGKVEALDEEA